MKTITVIIPASEPQTTTKEIQVPSYWKIENRLWGSEYLMVFTNTSILRVSKFDDGTFATTDAKLSLNSFFRQTEIFECTKDEAIQVFSEMQEAHRKLVFGDTTQKEIQNISIVDAYVENKPVIQLEIERKHTEF